MSKVVSPTLETNTSNFPSSRGLTGRSVFLSFHTRSDPHGAVGAEHPNKDAAALGGRAAAKLAAEQSLDRAQAGCEMVSWRTERDGMAGVSR